MRTEIRKFLRSVTPFVRLALVQASAVGIAAACVGWIPPALGSPACPDCYSGSTRQIRLFDVAGGMLRCAASPTVIASRVSQGEVNADLMILLEWHMTASHGYNLGHDNATCSAEAGMVAPMPLAASEVYEMLARSRYDADDAQSATGVTGGQHDPAAALRREPE